MKKICILLIVLVSALGLNAKWLYFDAGIGSDYTKISFTKLLRCEGTENLTGRSYSFYTAPNQSMSLGLRLGSRFALLTNIQSMSVEKRIRFRTELAQLTWDPSEADHNLHIKDISFTGVGFILYPRHNLQLRGVLYVGGSNYTDEVTTNNKVYINSGGGLGGGYDVSLAYDIPINKVGILLGCRYFKATIRHAAPLSSIEPEYVVSSTGLFVRIRY